jgi:hypothetical protein
LPFGVAEEAVGINSQRLSSCPVTAKGVRQVAGVFLQPDPRRWAEWGNGRAIHWWISVALAKSRRYVQFARTPSPRSSTRKPATAHRVGLRPSAGQPESVGNPAQQCFPIRRPISAAEADFGFSAGARRWRLLKSAAPSSRLRRRRCLNNARAPYSAYGVREVDWPSRQPPRVARTHAPPSRPWHCAVEIAFGRRGRQRRGFGVDPPAAD